MTALDIISSAMRLTGSLAQGETPSNDEAVDFLQRLNDLVDGWSIDPLMQFYKPITQYAWNATVASNPIGPTAGAPFNVTRPVKVERARWIQANTLLGFDMDIFSPEEWQAIVEKNNVAQIPRILYPDYNMPNMTLFVNPVPTFTGFLELTTWQTIAQLAALTTNAVIPPGYSEALQYGLAVRIAPELGMPLDPIIVQLAETKKQAIMQFNAALMAGVGEGTPPAPSMTQAQTDAGPAQQ